jgi:Skp family chaperone for outer membrane proteins
VVTVAEKRKLSAVFEASQGNILYLAKDADITEAVIEAMNRATK